MGGCELGRPFPRRLDAGAVGGATPSPTSESEEVNEDADSGIVFEEFREETCTCCHDEFVPNESEVWMAACGHATCDGCYNDPRGAR